MKTKYIIATNENTLESLLKIFKSSEFDNEVKFISNNLEYFITVFKKNILNTYSKEQIERSFYKFNIKNSKNNILAYIILNWNDKIIEQYFFEKVNEGNITIILNCNAEM